MGLAVERLLAMGFACGVGVGGAEALGFWAREITDNRNTEIENFRCRRT
jgi:hypothetical protein